MKTDKQIQDRQELVFYMMDKEKMMLIEYDIELVINKQLYEEKHITYDIYKKVANMILKDIENQTRKLESLQLINT